MISMFIVLTKCQLIPMLGTKCSHVGNKVFPRWESFPKPMVLASNIIGFSVQYHRF